LIITWWEWDDSDFRDYAIIYSGEKILSFVYGKSLYIERDARYASDNCWSIKPWKWISIVKDDLNLSKVSIDKIECILAYLKL